MSDRFEILLAKGRSGLLNPAETEELVRLLNAPLLEPSKSSLAEFTSKHTFLPSDVPERVRRIGWFSQVGKPLTINLTIPVVQVANWAEAVKSCQYTGWENAQLEAQNQLTMWLHNHDRAHYQHWNEFVSKYKQEVVTPLTETVLLPYHQRHSLDVAVVQSVQWDVLGALMENTYLTSGHSSFFFLELLCIYEAGHLPCGWQGEWPVGKLLVY
jgi:hypothetical protein